jgi:hypothetical protein
MNITRVLPFLIKLFKQNQGISSELNRIKRQDTYLSSLSNVESNNVPLKKQVASHPEI